MDEGFQRDLAWFVRFLETFNDQVYFNISPVSTTVHVDPSLAHAGGVWGRNGFCIPLQPLLDSSLCPGHTVAMFNGK